MVGSNLDDARRAAGTSSRPRWPPRALSNFGEIDQTWTIEDLIAEGDKVVVRATNRCQQESFLGVPSHGQWQTFSAIFIHRTADGKLVET